jgi:hypothetical protein
MKKLLLVLAIGSFVACNDSGSADEPATDTTTTAAPAPVDTTATNPADTTHADTTKKPADTTLKK